MSTKAQKARQDGKYMTLGALFLVDHAPECPEEMSWHDFSNRTIAEHLKRHSYYHYEKGNRELATVSTMRSRILYICNNYATAEMPKLGRPNKEFKDKVDVMFGYGGIELLKEVYLKKKGYEKGKFPESRLNKHVSEKDTTANAKVDGRPQDGMARGNDGSDKDASKTKSYDVGEEESRESEAGAVVPPSTQPTLPSPSSLTGIPLQLPGDGHTAQELNVTDNDERREQTGTSSGEQHSPSKDQGRQLRSSIDPQTQALSADNNTLCVNEKANATSSEEHSSPHNESFLGAKRKPTQDHGPQKRQCQTKDTTNQENSSDLRPHPDPTRTSEQANKTPSTDTGSNGLESPQKAVTNREKQPILQLSGLNLDQQGRNMKSMYTAIQKATDAILLSIGPIRHTPSPLHPESSGPLRDLYARCWGSRWEEVRVRQVGDQVFTTPQVTTSLLSAFLYDRILTRGLQLEELVSKVVGMGGSLGEALLKEFDIATRGPTIANRARIIEAQKVCVKLAQNGETLQQQLKQEADTLVKDASAIMAPHLQALSCSAKLFGLSSHRSETDTLNIFVSSFAKVIQEALHCRLQLLATGCEYAFTWPIPYDMFEWRSMQIDESMAENAADQSVVLFTIFPGLEIKPMSSDEMESVPDAEAVVKVQRSEDRF